MKKYNLKSAFTLIEIMVVTMFLAIIGTYTFGYMRATINTQKKIEEKTTIQQTGISIMTKLQDDITQTFFVESNQKLTYFIGGKNTISLTTLSHDAPSPDAHESEEAEVEYSLEADKNDTENKTQILLRKEVPYLSGQTEKDPLYIPIEVAKRVSDLEFSYSNDGDKYLDEWSTVSPDHPNTLPKLVRIKLTMMDVSGHEEYFESLIDLPMTDDINGVAASATTSTPGKTPATGSTTTNSSTSGITNNGASTSNSRGGLSGIPTTPVTQ